jgi:hypothetical protein
MIFRWLYKRSVIRAFGRFVPEHTIEELTDHLSEWESFKLLLPRAIYRLFFTPVMSDIDVLQTLQKMMLGALRDAPGVAGDKHGAPNPNSPTKPNPD